MNISNIYAYFNHKFQRAKINFKYSIKRRKGIIEDRSDLINYIIKKYNLNSYLEIGVGNGENFKRIKCKRKESCDPYFNSLDGKCIDIITYPFSSDIMFKKMDPKKKYNIIFIDGLHEGNQVLRDIYNSLNHLNSNGYILIHDSLPPSASVASFPRGEAIIWYGTVYKAYPILKENNIDFSIIDMDCGIGIIKGTEIGKSFPTIASSKSFQEIFESEYNYKKEFNVITKEDFITLSSFENK